LRARLLLPSVLFTLSCGGTAAPPPSGPSTPTPPPTSTTDTVNGCPVLLNPVARPGDNIGGDTYQTFARPFFAQWCTRCHSVTLTTAAARRGAPEGFNWDVESSVRENLERMRLQVGVYNTMPLREPDVPQPSCDERRRLIRWIDAGAP
jgi:hypothetical protein